MKIILYFFIALFLISCNNSSNQFSGKWKCSTNNEIYEFEKINKNTYLLKYGENQSRTGSVDENGVFEADGFEFVINENTGELIMPNNWGCKTASKFQNKSDFTKLQQQNQFEGTWLFVLDKSKSVKIRKKGDYFMMKQGSADEKKITLTNGKWTVYNTNVYVSIDENGNLIVSHLVNKDVKKVLVRK